MPQQKPEAKKKLGASPVVPLPAGAAKASSNYSFASAQPSIAAGLDPKLPFFIVVMLVFAFALFVYARMGLDSKDLFNLSEITITMGKLYSPAFFIFAFLISLSIGLAAFASRGVEINKAILLMIAATLLPSLILGLFVFSTYLYPFIALATAIVAAAIFANKLPAEPPSLSETYTIVSRALLIFTVAAFFITLLGVSQQREKYFDEFFFGIASVAPRMAAQGAGILSQVVENYQIDKASMEKIYPRDKIREQLAASLPAFSQLNASKQEETIDQTYEGILVPQMDSLKQGMSKSLKEFSEKPPAEINRSQIYLLKGQLSSNTSYIQIYDYFPLAMAFLVLSIIAIAKLPVQLLGTGITFLLLKYL